MIIFTSVVSILTTFNMRSVSITIRRAEKYLMLKVEEGL